jgi:PAS domain S-box-containing protein
MKRLHQNSATILIVDDVPANLGVMVESLEQFGHRVVVAQDGKEGLLRASIVKPDLILLDVMMPGMDGFEVCRRLKEQAETRDIPVVFMTALSDTADKIRGFTAGGSDYITKPFQMDEALARVGTQIKLRAMQRQLESQNEELQRYRVSLEQQVEERTNQLFASEQAFRALAENSPDYIARYDSDCRRMYLNPAVTKVLGHPPLGTPPDAQKSLIDIPGYAAQLRSVLETGLPSATEVRFRDLNGDVRWGHMRVVPEFGPDGDVVSVLAVCRDVHELKESEQRFRTLAENLPDVIIRYDVNGRKLYVNDAMEKLLGVDVKAILGQTAAETGTVVEVDAYDAALRATLATGEPHEIEAPVLNSAKAVRTYNVRFSPERNPQGDIVGALMVARDITERKQMEASIDKERATLRAFFRALPDLAWMKDAEGRYLACNPPFERFFGAAETEIVGKTDFDFVDAELARFFREKDKAAEAAGGPTINEEWITYSDDGRRVLLETVKAPVTDAQGNVIGVIGMGHDITERRRYEETLIERARLREQIASVAEAIPGFLYTTRIDANGVSTFPFASAGIEELFALRPDEIRDNPASLRSRYHPDDLPALFAAIRKSCDTLEPFRFEIRVRHPKHGLRWVDIRSTPRRLPDGTVEAHGLMTDITERKAAESELRRTYEMLQDLTAHRETAREEERKRVAREIHDELGQHLTALRMGISTLRFQFGRDTPLLGERVQELVALSDKTIQVVRDVAAALRPAVLDSGLGPALAWLTAQFQERSGIACKLDVPDDWPRIDEERAMALFRIVQESLTNIARHAKTPWASVELLLDDGEGVIRIRDGGQGFVPPAAGGKTFGLMGMRERALMLGGTLDIDSRPGEGTTVTARIPMQARREAP